MDVGFRLVGQVVVDDVRDVVDIEAAGGDVGGDQHAVLAGLKSVERALAGVLDLVAVDRLGRDAARFESCATTLVGAVLGAGEDQRASRSPGRAASRRAAAALLALVRHEDRLLDPLGGRRDRRRPATVTGLRRICRPARRSSAAWWRRTAASAACAGSLATMRADVVDEAHVEHAVGFVEHEDFDPREIDVALVHQVEQAAGRGDEMSTPLRSARTCVPWLTPPNGERRAQAEVAAIGGEALADLAGEFAGGGEDQDAAGLAAERRPVAGEPLQDRQGERGRLAGAGLGEPITSRPSRTSGMVCAWIGVGVA